MTLLQMITLYGFCGFGLLISWSSCVIHQKEKRMRYANSTDSNDSIHSLVCVPSRLSKEEEKAVKELAKLKGDTLIEIGIQQTLLSRDVVKIKQMMKDLLVQADRHEAMMQNIIGEKAMAALLKIPTLAITDSLV